ncbi:hypothetical protein CEP54_009910 [Fusarium duplospermum]|uniref:Zn(2)-C6 fungal-type domain-containing protein n=1 Tax=Fusarium duplospermum TaxID=1325734 RepID=A0A428PMN6_9HYPO|nr:hypothetical protein CEP54_009910 [Fusarium duplospermum]
MLLYARTAPPKARNTRSRTGCRFCKEMRKKCDECRPRCFRCKEHGKDCVYDPIRPRRRYKTRAASSGVSPPLLGDGFARDVWGIKLTPGLFLDIHQMVSSTTMDSPILDTPDPPIFSEWNKEPISFVTQTCLEPSLDFPAFCNFSNMAEERLLLAHFDCIMYELLMPSPGDTNPFQELILPLFLENMALLNGVDTPLGTAAPLWPTLYRLGELLDLKKELQAAEERKENTKVAVLCEELRISAQAIQSSLETWIPHSGADLSIQNGAYQDQSAIYSALSYLHSSLVYLFRTINNYPRSNHQVQSHVRASLKYCNEAVSAAGPLGAPLWPLFVAACETLNVVDRALANEAFQALSRRQGMSNVDRAWALTRQIWSCLDTGSAEMANSGVFVSHLGPVGDAQGISEVVMASNDVAFALH